MHRLCWVVRTLIAATVAAPACAVHVSGDLDGAAPPSMQAAFFGQLDIDDLGSSLGMLTVFGGSAGLDCDAVGDYLEVLDGGVADDIIAFEAERFPEGSWKLNIRFVTNDHLAGFVGEDFEPGTDRTMSLSLCRVDGSATPAMEGGPVERDEACFHVENGAVTITEIVDGERLEFNAERPLDVVDDDDVGAGEITIDGSVPHCQALSDDLEHHIPVP